MREVWSGNVRAPFVVSDVHARMPELAYRTVMAAVVRLAERGLLHAERAPGQEAVLYQAAGSPDDFLARTVRQRTDDLVRLYGDVAFAAFSKRLDRRDRSDWFDRLSRLDRLVGTIWVATLAVLAVIWIISTIQAGR